MSADSKRSSAGVLSFFRELARLDRRPLKTRAKLLSQALSDEYLGSDSIHARQVSPIDTRSVALLLPDKTSKTLLMFGSNDYLGFATDLSLKDAAIDATRQYGISFSGSPALNGTSRLLKELEARIASFKNMEDCVVFPSGFAANYGWIGALVQKGDQFVADEYSHTSAFEGIKGTLAPNRIKRFRHNDVHEAGKAVSHAQTDAAADVYLFIEGIYSMHGDLPDYPAFAELSHKSGSILVVDDAHGTGTLGPTGRGIDEEMPSPHLPTLKMGTLSKALGCVGGFVAADKDVANIVRARSPSLLFSAVPAPGVIAAAIAAFDIIMADTSRVRKLRQNVNLARRLLVPLGVEEHSASPVVSIPLPSHIPLRSTVLALQRQGIFVNGVEYPAIPLGEQRIRISINAAHTRDDIDALATALMTCLHTAAIQ